MSRRRAMSILGRAWTRSVGGWPARPEQRRADLTDDLGQGRHRDQVGERPRDAGAPEAADLDVVAVT
jgi:hypothetical protein